MTQPSQKPGFSISGLAIRRHIGTLMLTLAIIVLGGFFIANLQVDLLPSITYPRIGVRIDAPGISPEVGVDEVTKPLEEALSATEGVVQVFSRTREGRVQLDLYFKPGGNIDQALNDATATFNRARSQLPDTIEEPRIFKFDPSQLPVYEFALADAKQSPAELRVFADEELARELNVISGVAAVDVSGGLQEEIRVQLDLDRLQAQGISLQDVLDKLRNANQDASGGRILGQTAETLTRVKGRFQHVDEIRNLSFEVNPPNVGTASGTSAAVPLSPHRVYLRDFATVLDGTQKQRIFVNLNGNSAVKVSIQKQPDANTIAVVEAVKERLQALRQSNVLPPEMSLIATLDESIFIRNAIANVTNAGLAGTALAAIAVLLFLGSLRQTLIVVLAIPFATLAAIILMGVFGFSLNVFSLGGLALGVGIVVDNSIVMLEAIAEGTGMTPGSDAQTRLDLQTSLAVSERSSQAIESALLASTSTNLVAVLPFLLIGGFISLLFNELILTVSFAVAASIAIAVTIVPMLTSRLLPLRVSSGLNRFWAIRQFNQRFEASTRGYGRWLRRVLDWRWAVVVVAVVVCASSSLWMVDRIPQEILPAIATGQVNLRAQFPPGTPLAASQRVMAATDKLLDQQPETEYVFTTVGGALFGNSTSENPLSSSSTVTLKPGTDVDAFISKMERRFRNLNLVDIRLRLSPGQVRGLILNNSPVRGADIDVVLAGQDVSNLEAAGRQVLVALDEQVELASFRPDLDDRQPELQIVPDRERLAALNLDLPALGETLETAIQGSVPTQLQRGNRLVDVRVELNEAAMRQPSQLSRLPLFEAGNRQIRLGDVATIAPGQAPGEIQRINQRQVYIISGNLTEGAALGEALAETDRVLQGLELPEGVSILPSAAAESNRQIQGTLPVLGGLAVFLVFVVMAVQYNSLLDPLVILFAIPLSLAGGIFGLYVTQTAIGATTIVGVVLLVGIVVNNAIIMVELANQIREREGCDRRSAILQAAPQRLRPILMTTITTVLGMFPLALGIGQGGEFLQPLGVVVFSGLSLATVLTLFLIPCLYLIVHDAFSGPGRQIATVPMSAMSQDQPSSLPLPSKKR